MSNTNHQERILARLSFAAFAVDLLAIVLLIVLLKWVYRADFWADILGTYGDKLQDWGLFFAFLLAPLIHLFIVEVVFGGFSIGRVCTGLSVRDLKTGDAPTFSARLKRFASVLLSLGLRSLRFNKLSNHNKREECCLCSDWAGTANQMAVVTKSSDTSNNHQTSPKKAHITVLSGPLEGKRLALTRGRHFKTKGIFVIGRDPNQADLVLTGDDTVSRVHCHIIMEHPHYFLMDGDISTKASSDGTFLNGQKVSSTKKQRLINGHKIKIRNNILKFTLDV